MTAMIIPNAIQITTTSARYAFASFLARDTTYDLILSIWRISHPSGIAPSVDTEPSTALLDSEDSHEEGEKDDNQPSRGRRRRAWKRRLKSDKSVPQTTSTQQGASREAMEQAKKVAHRPTAIPPSVETFKDVMMDETFNATPEKIYNLMFTSEQFMRDFWANNQKLTGGYL